MEPYSSAAIFRVGALDFSFPWNRTFEIDFDVSCSQADSANVYVYHPAYIQGVGDGMFRPMDALSRSQAAKMLVAVTDTPMDDSEVCPFDDVASWASPYVAAAYARGYMRGYGNGSFRGNDSITRVEFVAMLAQYAKAENIKLEQQTDITFNDVPEDGQAWYTENVYLLAHAGIINGYSDGDVPAQRQGDPHGSCGHAGAHVRTNGFRAGLDAGILDFPRCFHEILGIQRHCGGKYRTLYFLNVLPTNWFHGLGKVPWNLFLTETSMRVTRRLSI